MSLLVDVSRLLLSMSAILPAIPCLLCRSWLFHFALEICVSTRVKKEVLTKGFDSHPSLFFSSLVVFKIFSHLLVYCHNRLIPFFWRRSAYNFFLFSLFLTFTRFLPLKDFFFVFHSFSSQPMTMKILKQCLRKRDNLSLFRCFLGTWFFFQTPKINESIFLLWKHFLRKERKKIDDLFSTQCQYFYSHDG